MVKINSVPPVEYNNIWYSWNLRNRKYEVDEYLTTSRNNKKVDKDLFKAIAGVATLNPEAIVGLGQGITGNGYDNLFKATSKMSDEEVALGILSLIAFSLAPSVGSRMAKGKSPSLKEIKESPKFKKEFPNNDINIDASILTQKYIYDSASYETKLKMRIQANQYRNTKLREEQRLAGEKGDMSEYNRIQNEINQNIGNKDLNELREIENRKIQINKEKENASREELLNLLQEETGNELTNEEWGDLYAMRFQKNPSKEEFYNFKKSELENQAKTGENPQSVVDAWFERYGTNEQGIDRDLQELGRRVMMGLDDGTGEPNLDNLNRYVYDNYGGQEREAIIDAFNEKSIWNNWKSNYKNYLAGSVAIGSSVVASKEISNTGEDPSNINLEEEEEEEEMDLDEAVRDEAFIKKGEGQEIEIGAGGEVVEEKTLPPPILSPDERDAQLAREEDTKVDFEEEVEENFFREEVDIKNIDELLRLTFRASSDVYDPSVFTIEGEYFLIDGYSVPVLFHKIGNKLIVALRGTDSIANMISDLYTTNPFLIGENKLGYYDFFKKRINEKNNIDFHAGFIQALVYPPSKQARLGSKLESDYTPLYQMIRNNIDKFKGEITDLIFTGHSLGGALASMVYYLYQLDSYEFDEKITNSVRCVSFGSPRFVIKGGEDYYNEVCPNLIRVWNEFDIVSYIPLYREVPTLNLGSGFIHVGKSLCLDSPLSRNDPNQLIVEILQEKKPALRALKGMTIEEGVDACNVIKSSEYQRNIFKGVIEQMGEGVKVKDEITEEQILEMESKTLNELKMGKSVGEVYKGLGLDTLLKEAIVGEDPRQKEFYYSSMFGFIIGANAQSTKAHKLTTYKENIDKLIDLEINTKVDILEKQETIEEAVEENIEELVDKEIKEEVDELIEEEKKQIPILGFIDNFEGLEIISI